MDSYQNLIYKSMGDLELAMQSIAMQLPPGVDRVVGIPRSGLLAANMLALQINLPLADLGGFIEGRELDNGRRDLRAKTGARRETVVVVDDSVLSGRAMSEARAQLANTATDAIYVSPFVTHRGRQHVDLWAEIVPEPRIFSWNILHHREIMARTCFDIDGVLCRDPTTAENDDGARYSLFIETVGPMFMPSAPVGYVVTSRLERYRAQTERWLRQQGLEFRELVMLNVATAEERRRSGVHAKHKAGFYAASGAQLFIESEHAQAREIAELSGRQVFALDRREMVYPTGSAALRHALGPTVRSLGALPPAQALYWATRERLGRAGVGRLAASIGRRRRDLAGNRTPECAGDRPPSPTLPVRSCEGEK